MTQPLPQEVSVMRSLHSSLDRVAARCPPATTS